MNAAPQLITRESLLRRLKNWDDQESWRDFFSTYWKLIYNVAVKAGLSDDEACDVVQETVLAVAKQMRNSQYKRQQGHFKPWLLGLTRWRIADQYRKRQRQVSQLPPDTDSETINSFLDQVPDPASLDIDSVWDEEWQKNLLATAVERIKNQVSPKQFQIFDCYVLKQWPAKQISKILKVNLAQIYLAKHRIACLLNKEIERLEKQESNVT